MSSSYSFPHHCIPHRTSVGSGLLTNLFESVKNTHMRERNNPPRYGWKRVQGNFTRTGRILFYNVRMKKLEYYRCMVPNFIIDQFISIIPTVVVLPLQFRTGPSKLFFEFPEIVRPFPSVGGLTYLLRWFLTMSQNVLQNTFEVWRETIVFFTNFILSV